MNNRTILTVLAFFITLFSYNSFAAATVDANGYIVEDSKINKPIENKKVNSQPKQEEMPFVENIVPEQQTFYEEQTTQVKLDPKQNIGKQKNLNLNINTKKALTNEIITCNDNVKTLYDSKQKLQNTILELSELIKENTWINNTKYLSNYGQWAQLKDLYNWVDFSKKFLPNKDIENCEEISSGLNTYISYITRLNVDIIESIYMTKERTLKIKQEANCVSIQACDPNYLNYLFTLLQRNSNTNGQTKEEITALGVASINKMINKLNELQQK